MSCETCYNIESIEIQHLNKYYFTFICFIITPHPPPTPIPHIFLYKDTIHTGIHLANPTLKQRGLHLYCCCYSHAPFLAFGSAGEYQPGEGPAQKKGRDGEDRGQPYWDTLGAVSRGQTGSIVHLCVDVRMLLQCTTHWDCSMGDVLFT